MPRYFHPFTYLGKMNPKGLVFIPRSPKGYTLIKWAGNQGSHGYEQGVCTSPLDLGICEAVGPCLPDTTPNTQRHGRELKRRHQELFAHIPNANQRNKVKHAPRDAASSTSGYMMKPQASKLKLQGIGIPDLPQPVSPNTNNLSSECQAPRKRSTERYPGKMSQLLRLWHTVSHGYALAMAMARHARRLDAQSLARQGLWIR